MVTRSSRRLYSHLNRISEKPPPDAPYRGYKKRPPGKGSLAYKCQTPPGSERVFFLFLCIFLLFFIRIVPPSRFSSQDSFYRFTFNAALRCPFPTFRSLDIVHLHICLFYVFFLFRSFLYVLCGRFFIFGFIFALFFLYFFLMCVGVIIHRSVTEYFRFNSRTRKSCNEFKLEMFLTCFEIVVSFSIIFRSAH